MLVFRLVPSLGMSKGNGLIYHKVKELAIDYTNCIQQSPSMSPNLDTESLAELRDIPDNRVQATFKKPMVTKPQWGHARANYTWPISGLNRETDVCILSFNIPDDLAPPVLFYYRLTNFYQNHRRYVRSIDIDQLKGNAKTGPEIDSGDCTPLTTNSEGKPYYPCGLIANSMFNDTYDNLRLQNNRDGGDTPQYYNFTTAGTSWAHEGDLYGKTSYKPEDVAVPPFWVEQFPDGKYDTSKPLPDLHTWEQFQVWMRTAGLPTFSKLAQRNDNDKLMSGTYWLKIYDRKTSFSPPPRRLADLGPDFPVESYSGTKSILISTRTVMGGKNDFLGIAYLVVGGLCILLGAFFLATHLIKPRYAEL